MAAVLDRFMCQKQGELLKAFREETGLSQEKFGKLFGYTQGAISQMEDGARKVPPQMRLSAKRVVCQHFQSVMKSITTLRL